MKIYKLTANEIASEPQFSISSYISPRNTKYVLYFVSQEKAKEKQKELYDSSIKLLGFMPRVEFILSEIDVIE